MAKNRVFFPQAALDSWLAEGNVELDGMRLTMREEGRRYQLVEAVRVLHELAGGQDLYGLVHRVKTVAFLTELGAELLGESMVLGDAAYEVVPGFVGRPVGSFAEHRTERARESAGDLRRALERAMEPASDEDLLAQFLMKSL